MTMLLQKKPTPATKRRSPRQRREAVTSSELRLLTFNIGAAAVERAGAILRWLRTRPEDVIVLTETSAGAGTQLLAEGLRASGFAVLATPHPRERGVLVASRLPAAYKTPVLDVTLPCRAAAVTVCLGDAEFAVVGVYVPSRDRSEAKIARKQAFVASLIESLRLLPRTVRERLVLAGDYNAVARSHHPVLGGFFPWEYEMHDELARIGLRSAHEVRGGGLQPHSWIGRTGIGYLYDYVHLGEQLQGSLMRCSYLHGPRERRLSDHAAVSVRLHPASSRR